MTFILFMFKKINIYLYVVHSCLNNTLASRLYWADGRKNHIESSDLDGGNRRVLATDSGAFINDIVIHGQYLFYTAWQRE